MAFREDLPQELVTAGQALIDPALRYSPGIKRVDAEVGAGASGDQTRRVQAHPDVLLRFGRQISDRQLAGQGSNSRILVGLHSQLGAGLSSF